MNEIELTASILRGDIVYMEDTGMPYSLQTTEGTRLEDYIKSACRHYDLNPKDCLFRVTNKKFKLGKIYKINGVYYFLSYKYNLTGSRHVFIFEKL